jgi:hypothetical protein
MNILVIIGTINLYLYLAVNTNISVQFRTLSEVIRDRSKNSEHSTPIEAVNTNIPVQLSTLSEVIPHTINKFGHFSLITHNKIP